MPMHQQKSMFAILVCLAFMALASTPAFGQGLTTGGIRGRVTDPSGAAVAGVNVTATSPALLVAQVTTATDSSGDYKFADLPIGTYRVVYQASGFQQLVRENVVLTAGFTAPLDVALQVGNVNESVTVQAESPIVDTEHTTTGTDLSAKVLTDVIPTTRNAVEYLSTTPGVIRANRPDFGGGTSGGGQYEAYGIQGQMTMLLDGVNTTQSVINQGTGNGPDFDSLEEMQVLPVNGSAEVANPGIVLNLIVKSGGNQFHGRVEGTGEWEGVQSDNLTPTLRAEGFKVAQNILSYETFSGDLGGPIKKDKLWFYGAYHYQHGVRNALGFLKYPTGTNIYNVSSAVGTAADLSSRLQNETAKITYQITQKYKLSGLFAWHTELFDPYPTGPDSLHPLESNPQFHWNPHQMKLELQGTPTPRLVFDVLIGRQAYVAQYTPEPGTPAGPNVSNLTTGQVLGPSFTHDIRPRRSIGPSGTISYFPTGSLWGTHEIKAGGDFLWQIVSTSEPDLAPFNYGLVYQNLNAGASCNGVVSTTPVTCPYELITKNFPTFAQTYQNQGGFFVQDAWRPTKRLIINAGLRLDTYITGIPNESRVASQFASAGTFPGLSTGTWNQLAPRVGFAWNVFGNNKTVIRGSFGRFNHAFGDDYASVYNQDAITTTTYLWHAPVGTTVFTPGQSDLSGSSKDFVAITGASNQLLNLKLKDPHTNEFMIGVEREILPGLSVKANYTWVKQINLFGNYNVLRPYSFWNIPFTTFNGKPIVDPGPDGKLGTGDDGSPITLYGYPQQYQGSAFVQNQYTPYPNSSAPIFKILDIIVSKRFSGKWGLSSSITTIRNHTPAPNSTLAGFGAFLAPIPASPNANYFNYDRTWNWQTKATVYYNFPWKVVASSTFEGYNGLHGQRLVNFTSANSGIPSYIGTLTVGVEPFGAENGPVRLLWNLQVGREFYFKERFRLKPSVDILNLLNRADPWAITYTSGPSFNIPTTIDTPRIARFAMVFNF